DAAKKQFVASHNWRKENHIDRLPCATRQNKLPLLVNVRGYDAIDDGNVDSKPGLSQTVIRIANTMGGDCFHKISMFQTASNEFLNRVIMPECSRKAGRIIFKETVIFDCTHMGIRQFQMTALHYLKAVIDTIQNYYPETLHRLFIVNAPGILHTIWRIVKPWLEQRTADKVFILNHSETPKVLTKYIAPENLPQFLGGSCTCDHIQGGCVPSVMLGNVPPLKVSEYNDNVPTPYNTDIMQAALKDNSYRNPT
ncbi:CRAL/TRIO domain-containing protein, partial [Lichtheimia hyalospora FSU 10163]